MAYIGRLVQPSHGDVRVDTLVTARGSMVHRSPRVRMAQNVAAGGKPDGARCTSQPGCGRCKMHHPPGVRMVQNAPATTGSGIRARKGPVSTWGGVRSGDLASWLFSRMNYHSSYRSASSEVAALLPGGLREAGWRILRHRGHRWLAQNAPTNLQLTHTCAYVGGPPRWRGGRESGRPKHPRGRGRQTDAGSIV